MDVYLNTNYVPIDDNTISNILIEVIVNFRNPEPFKKQNKSLQERVPVNSRFVTILIEVRTICNIEHKILNKFIFRTQNDSPAVGNLSSRFFISRLSFRTSSLY